MYIKYKYLHTYLERGIVRPVDSNLVIWQWLQRVAYFLARAGCITILVGFVMIVMIVEVQWQWAVGHYGTPYGEGQAGYKRE